jgi:glycoside/pentoside/hexuronide:cation symporter, GPH family
VQQKQQSARQVQLSLGEKIGFGMGDLGFNFYWTTVASFLAAFYTDVFGLQAGAAAGMMLLTRVADAITDPVMGAIADRTRTRWGKFRPYLLFAALPLAGAGVLTFTTPDLDASGKLVWAYVTYTLMMLMYTVLSMPYSALSGVMTSDSEERTSLISIRFIFAFVGGTLVNWMTLPLVEWLGAGDEARGWQLTMVVYGIAACTIFAVTFASTRERVTPPAQQETNVRRDLADLLRSRPWVVLFVLAMVIMMVFTMRGGSAYYYFKYYVERPELLKYYLPCQTFALAAGAWATPYLTRLVDKPRLLMISMGLVAALSGLFYLVPKDNIPLIFTFNILISCALGPKAPLTWSMYADTADYNEWKNGRRATAMTFAAASFAQKLGGSLGSAGMLAILASIGYVANEAQTGASQTGIALLQTIYPGMFALLSVAVIPLYNLSYAQLDTIQNELDQRHAQTGTS